MTGSKFPKDLRLLTRRQFQRVSREGERLVGRYLCVDACPSRRARLGISASAKYGSSPERNRFKRMVREAFRKCYPELPPFDLNVIPRKFAKDAKSTQIMDELKKLLASEAIVSIR